MSFTEPINLQSAIVQERDNAGHPREHTDFFGFEPDELAQFRDGWEPSRPGQSHPGHEESHMMP